MSTTSQPVLEDYKSFFDDTPVALIRTDAETGEFLMANKYAAFLLGFNSVDELKQHAKTIAMYLPGKREELLEELKRHGYVENYEIEIVLPNKKLWVSARLRMNESASAIDGSLVDITPEVMLRNSHLHRLQEVSQKIDKQLATLEK